MPIAKDPIAPGPACVDAPPGTPASAGAREQGIDAFLAGRDDEAVRLLEAAVAADPRDRVADGFLAAASARVAASREASGTDAQSSRPVTLQLFPLIRTVLRHAAVSGGTVHLEKQSEARNLITDDADWAAKNKLAATTQMGVAGLPSHVAPTLGRTRLSRAFLHPDHVAAVYGSMVVVSAEGKRPRVFDAGRPLGSVSVGAEVTFAQLVGQTLVLALGYNGYAKASRGMNGFVTAFDATTGALLWLSDPLVANSWEALVAGSSLVIGYGFTAEPDFLFVLDLTKGDTLQKIPLKSAPSLIRAKGDRVFVRAYDVDYVFRSTTGMPVAMPAEVAGATSDGPPPVDAETRCWVRRATTAIAQSDAATLHDAIAHLKPLSRDRALMELLAREEDRMQDSRLDLMRAPLVTVAPPPWQAQPASTPAGGATGPSPTRTLVKLSSRAASSVRNMDPPFNPAKPAFIAPAKQGALPNGARRDIPSKYGQEYLEGIIPDEQRGPDKTMLIYGGRYLAWIEGTNAVRVYDLDAFQHPPRANPQWKEFATQPVSYAQERDGVLYVCNGRGSYAKEVFGTKAFLSALDSATGKLLWRSPALTCGLMFQIAGDTIVSGYGFTAEPDFVTLIRRADGRLLQKVPIDSAPDTIELAGTSVHVESYGHVIELELR
jgi:outer membrane protein assembly factor BamB